MTVPAPPVVRAWPAVPDLEDLDLGAIGTVAGAEEACLAVEATLLTWLPSYVVALTNAGGPELGVLTRSEQLPDSSTESSWGTPALFMSSPGTVARPVRSRSTYLATWQVNATVVDRGADWRDTQQRLRRWVDLMRTVVLQHRGLTGECSGADWISDGYARGTTSRTLGYGTVAFSVPMAGVVDLTARPELPELPTSGPGSAPTVAAFDTTDLILTRIDTEAS